MAVFVDTSAVLTLRDADDLRHQQARQLWQALLEGAERLVTTNYVMLESIALLQRRFGIQAVREFQTDIVPVLDVEWVDSALHQAGLAAVLAAGRRQLSLVDCVSFAVMRRLGLARAFAFDADFAAQGFTCLP